MTPFQESGFTEITKFKVLRDYDELRVGDIVTLHEDDGDICPDFKTEDGRKGYMWLPNAIPDTWRQDLEVYEGDK